MSMFAYFRSNYLELSMGWGFVLTEISYATGMVFVYERISARPKDILNIIWHIPAVWLLGLFFSTLANMLPMSTVRNLMAGVLMILVYCLLSRSYSFTLRLVRGCVYFACYQQALTISEAAGVWLREAFGVEQTGTILDSSTWVVIALILTTAVILINRWGVEDVSYLPPAPIFMILVASGLGVFLPSAAGELGVGRAFDVIVACAFLFLEMFSYYLLYILSKSVKENMELLTLEHKEKMDEELLQSFHDNLEEMHMVRHEIRNHMAYIRFLVSQEEYDKLFDYTNSVLGEAEVLFRTVASGNDVVDAVMNHEIQKAAKAGITIQPTIIAPPSLPFSEKDFCSVLSNLLDNAIEATQQSGEKDPVIEISIQPRQDYLFLRVTNPVNEKTRRRGVSLRTTKENAAFHGYGTKIVRRIVESYEGTVNYDIRDGRFVADVMMVMKTPEEKT